MKHTIIILLALVFMGFSGCNESAKTEKKSSQSIIITTTGMLADAVKNIVQDSAKVGSLMGPGVDPHLYKASHGDISQLTTADVIIYNGLHLEGKMGEVLQKVAKIKPVIAAGEYIPIEGRRQSSTYKGTYDPHV